MLNNRKKIEGRVMASPNACIWTLISSKLEIKSYYFEVWDESMENEEEM